MFWVGIEIGLDWIWFGLVWFWIGLVRVGRTKWVDMG